MRRIGVCLILIFLLIVPVLGWDDTLSATIDMTGAPDIDGSPENSWISSDTPLVNITEFECSGSFKHTFSNSYRGNSFASLFDNDWYPIRFGLGDWSSNPPRRWGGETDIGAATSGTTYSFSARGYENGTVYIYENGVLKDTLTGMSYYKGFIVYGQTYDGYTSNTMEGSCSCNVNYDEEEYAEYIAGLYSINFTGSGTFCYGNPIAFTLSEESDTPGLYGINCFKEGSSKYPLADHAAIGLLSPFTYNVVLEPGNWACQGVFSKDEAYLTEWLNFTIDSTCTAQSFNGTINEGNNPFIDNFEFNWEDYDDFIDGVTPYTDITYDYGNGTSFIDYLYRNGLLTIDEYNQVYNAVQNEINNSTNVTNYYNNISSSYTFGILTPFRMINDSVSTIRANTNSSVTTLSTAISPITSIFTWIFQILPTSVVNLLSVVLVLDGSRIILFGRKN